MSYLKNAVGLVSLLDKEQDIFAPGGPFDRLNPRSLINIAPNEVVEVLREKMPVSYLFMNETELESQFRPGPDLQKIRIAFWKEFEMAQSDLRKMNVARIGQFLGQSSVYLLRVLKDPEKLAVILCPVASYENFLEESLMAGSRKLRQIIEMPLFDENGRPDHKTMDIVLKAVAFLDMRKHGGIVQKQLQVNMTKNTQNNLIQNASLEELDEKIKQLEQKNELEIKTIDKDINALEAKFSGKTTRT